MKVYSDYRALLSILVVLAICVGPVTRPTSAAPPQTGRGGVLGGINRDDPCTHLPTPPGQALGISKQCPPGGSSSGVVKGDFNGDGFADLAIAEPGASINGQSGAGDVIIMPGSASGVTSTGRQLWFEGIIPGTSAEGGDHFGTALASGDFNGDGFSDLAIGIPGKKLVTSGIFGNTIHPQSGAVVVIYGSPNGLTTTDPNFPPPRVFNLSMAALPALPFGCGWSYDKAALGSSLAWGDFNHDGRGDLAAGAPGLSPGACLTFTGGVWTIPGSCCNAVGGLSLANDAVWTPINIPGVDSSTTLSFGSSLAAGDFNGDLKDDLAVGSLGTVTVVDGGTSGVNPANGSQVWTPGGLTGSGNGGNDPFFGWTLAAGDFNGDGKADLAIGNPLGVLGSAPANSGLVVVLYGSPTVGLTAAGSQFWNSPSLGQPVVKGDSFGWALAAGDFNGDGKTDLAVGIPLKDFGGLTDAGEVNVIYGSPTGLSIAGHSPTILHDLIGPTSGQQFGTALTAWNFGRDELFGTPPLQFVIKTADLAVGIPLQNVAGVSGAGAVNVFYGSFYSNGITTANAQNLTAFSVFLDPLAGAHFGGALY